MELEKEIRQDKFANEYHKLIVNVVYTGNWLTASVARFLKTFGISPQQFNILRILRGQHGELVSVGLIQERMLDKSSNVTRLVDKLEAKALVKRKIADDDRRKIYIQITEGGLNMLAEIDKNEAIDPSNTIDTLSEEEARQLNQLLDKLRG